jgi:hypothetical protein
MLERNKHWEKKANGWVFLSHSSKDYQDVKIVRNYLEENGFSAIMFYLKSLEEPSRIKDIKRLLKWEIEDRNIFVSCNSQYAKKSKWFRWERRYAKCLTNKIYREIDMDKLKYERCTQLSKLDSLIKEATLFFLYSHKDNDKVDEVYDFLETRGFRTFKDTRDIKIGNDFEKKVDAAIKSTIEKGTVLIFLSKNAIESKWFWKEKSMALNQDAFIIPILLDSTPIWEFPAFENKSIIDLSNGFEENKKEELLEAIYNERIN